MSSLASNDVAASPDIPAVTRPSLFHLRLEPHGMEIAIENADAGACRDLHHHIVRPLVLGDVHETPLRVIPGRPLAYSGGKECCATLHQHAREQHHPGENS